MKSDAERDCAQVSAYVSARFRDGADKKLPDFVSQRFECGARRILEFAKRHCLHVHLPSPFLLEYRIHSLSCVLAELNKMGDAQRARLCLNFIGIVARSDKNQKPVATIAYQRDRAIKPAAVKLLH